MSVEELDLEGRLSALIDDGKFEALNDRMARFNVFEAMGAVRSELRHSNFLALLFSPTRPHGLGSEPLLRVLRAVLDRIDPKQRPLRPLELVVGDLDGAIVYRERDNMDLLVEIKAMNLVVLFENKVGAKAGEGQLASYKSVLTSRYPNERRLLVFLTPDGIAPDEEGYVAFDFGELANILDGLVNRLGADSAPKETALIIHHYTEMLRRHIVPDEKLQEIARQLYQRHKEAFDFVFECRPTPENLMDTVRELVVATPGLVEDRHYANIFRFVPESWSNAARLNACPPEEWTRTARNVIFEVKTYANSDRVSVGLCVGPAEQALRAHLYNRAKEQTDVFQGLVKPMGRLYATIYIRDLLSAAEAKAMDFEQKAEVLRGAWNSFVTDTLPVLENAMIQIIGVDPP
jgi:hypothetical protein